MRKNHHGKKDRLVKRVFALCLALAVICTCLVPVFATEGLSDPHVNQEASRPVDDGEASYPDDGFAGFGEEEATRPVDGGEGGEDNLDGGPSVQDSEWGTVIDYGTSTDPSSSTETQWSGEDDVVEKPDDKVVVSGDEIKKLQDMVVYRFWLRELNTLDLQDITAQAQINNMTESEYLARNGEVLWNLYFIQAVPRAETIADYSSYIENPSSNRDPKGELRQFDYWYTLDEFGNRVRLNLTDPTSNILDDKTTTVNVYAAWKDGTVGSDEEEDVDHEDLVDKNPVPVNLETKAAASYEDEDGIEIVSIEIDGVEYPNVNDGIATISSIQGDAKVPVGATITLRSKNGKSHYEHKWIITPNQKNPGEAKFVDSNGNLVDEIYGVGDTFKTVRLKVTKTGELTINHRHGDPKADDKHKLSNGDELNITVVESNQKDTYNLYVYTQVLGYSGDYYGSKAENKAWNGMAVGTISNVVAPSNYNKCTSIYDTADIDTKLGTEIIVDSGQFPVIPIKQNGQYKDYYYLEKPSSWESDTAKKNYGGTYTIEWYEVVAVGGANTGKNGKDGDWTNEKQYKSQYTSGIYKSPISSVSSNKMTYHLDGLIVLHDTTHINVKFMVQDVGKDTFALVRDYGGAFTVPEGSTSISLSNIDRPDVLRAGQTEADCPATKETADGTVYKFEGWYTDQNFTCESKFDFTEDTISADTTFYAKYVPASANLTVTKTVTGKLGDTNKAFTFTITKEGKPVDNITEDNIEVNDGAQWLNEDNGKFTLKDGASITFKNLPSGEYKIVEEDYTGEKYETSYVVDSGTSTDGQEATVTIGTDAKQINFTNHRTLEPDLGVLLDTLPYIVILAVVAGGVALLMLRKRRKEDD